jgi:isopenicillin N synthase-like dioxygenase
MTSTVLNPCSSSGSALPPFPDDIPVAPLVTISLRELEKSISTAEHEHLFSAAKSLGFFYLDLQGTTEGEKLLKQADALFDLMNDFFSLPVEEKTKFDFAAKKIYFGYKGIGKEVVDGKGTRDKNELYNVTQSLRHPQY